MQFRSFTFLFCLTCVACSILPTPSGRVSKYILVKPNLVAYVGKARSLDLLVLQPSLSTVLQENNRILYYPTSQKIEYLAGGEWVQKVDLIIWECLIDSFKSAHVFRTVTSDPTKISDSPAILRTYVAFLGVVNKEDGKYVQVVYEFVLEGKDNKVLWQKTIEESSKLEQFELDGVVADLNKLHQNALKELITSSVLQIPNLPASPKTT